VRKAVTITISGIYDLSKPASLKLILSSNPPGIEAMEGFDLRVFNAQIYPVFEPESPDIDGESGPLDPSAQLQ
jgi:hypothetical protein